VFSSGVQKILHTDFLLFMMAVAGIRAAGAFAAAGTDACFFVLYQFAHGEKHYRCQSD